ncbi:MULTISPECIES: RagB/SusD family nutrient uptake outer membrane protein [unclassified Sphingobacterium]|uniref:RagB/SusD family nutrient uptake outer membrane protein n=1 Tax=unclassified Sphingobacterium TaxID=2609468 RepID=UPI00104D5ACF|nr:MULTISPECIES: RagB/SusD family nutrient uptake outer membrane protein [unclassified Sphingobacterium]MCS3553552.1 hypothetical protein [Sphingobacterium sp. JUb21]TCR09239.1 putative outer membrane starch-binding protein [Sphingobacterium sp. JUb20]
MKNIFSKCIIILFIIISSSCSKYLDVSNELAGGLTSLKEVFNKPSYARSFYANIFVGIPDYSNMVRSGWDAGGQTGLHNPWTGMTDEISPYYGDVTRAMISDRNSNNMLFHRWVTVYQLIRQANLFLENAKAIPPSGVDAEQLDQEELNRMKANVVFMRAYYHYLLLEQYGPIPILDRSYTDQEDIDVPRKSVDEVVAFIDGELQKSIQDLNQIPYDDDNFKALPTKGVALAVRAKLWMHTASPLLNGGYPEAVALKNADGQTLFPSYDAKKWTKAVTVLKDFIDYAASYHQLYKVYKAGVLDPEASVYELFQVYNPEIIWATPNTGWGGMDGDRFERRATPKSEPNGLGATGVMQELIDDFYMKDGLPIKDTKFLSKSQGYSESGFSQFNGAEVFNMYINREPRFYNTVFFAGRKWHISNKVIQFHMGSANDRVGPTSQVSPNGYLLYKRFNRRVHKTSPGVANVFRPSIIFRLAEFYLLYAEALNETDPSNPDILKYVNLIRERAGIPNLQVLNPAIAGNQELQRLAIQRESRIELATEGQRYFDVRRWMIAEKEEARQGGDFYGMDMAGDYANFFKRTKFETRVFNKKMYLYPIPFTEIQKSKNLVQNPGW